MEDFAFEKMFEIKVEDCDETVLSKYLRAVKVFSISELKRD